MPTPSIDDEHLIRAIELRQQHGSTAAAARAAGVPRTTFQHWEKLAAERGLMGFDPIMPGFAVKTVSSRSADGVWVKQAKAPGDVFEVPDGHAVKGISALVDAEGRTVQRWIKTREDFSPTDIAEILKTAFLDYPGRAGPTPPPAAARNDLLTLIPCNDWHINLLTWEREVGTNWDLHIAERVIGEAIDEAIQRSPSCGTAIVLSGGDLIHADNNENRTARSGNQLDVDSRHQKGLEVACRLMVRTIDAALVKNDDVIVRILKGNHDEHTAVAVAYFLHAWYRDEPRVMVDLDASLFFWHRFGLVFLGATHGHTVKIQEMAGIMAHRRAADWGATRFRYVHGFHLHHAAKFQTEGGGVISEVHQAPIPQDVYHFGAGFLSGRSVQTITYHRNYGEVSRARVAILDAEEIAA